MFPHVGDIYNVEIPYEEHIQSGFRPVVITSNDQGNQFSGFIHGIPLTGRLQKAHRLKTHVVLSPSAQNGLKRPSVALVENMRPIPKQCLRNRLGSINQQEKDDLSKAMRIQFPFS